MASRGSTVMTLPFTRTRSAGAWRLRPRADPTRPAATAAPRVTATYESAHHRQSSRRDPAGIVSQPGPTRHLTRGTGERDVNRVAAESTAASPAAASGEAPSSLVNVRGAASLESRDMGRHGPAPTADSRARYPVPTAAWRSLGRLRPGRTAVRAPARRDAGGDAGRGGGGRHRRHLPAARRAGSRPATAGCSRRCARRSSACCSLCLLRPMLVLRAAVPHQNVVGVLLDDSRSMRIADVNGQPRSTYVQQEFGSADAGLRKALGERFTVRTLRFAGVARAGADGRGSDLHRHQHPAGGGARRGAPAAGGRAAGRPGRRERRRRHERRRPRAGAASAQGLGRARLRHRRRAATPPSATSRWAGSPRRARCWRARPCCSTRS